MWLKQSTAVVVSFGPALDKTDGVTPETGLVSALDHVSTGIFLSKNGAALTIRHATVTASTYDAYGNYRVTLDTTDTNTLGTLRMQFIETATCLPVWQDFMIVPSNVWDSMFGADNLQVDCIQLAGQTVTAAAGVTFPSSVASPTNITAGTITTVGSVTGAVGSVTGAVGSVTGNVGGNVVGTVASVTGAVGSVTGNVGGNVVGTVASVTGNVGGNVVGSVGSVTGSVGSVTAAVSVDAASVRTAVGLASANLDTQLDALPTAIENADALLDRSNGIETSLSPRGAFRLITAASAGKLSGAATATVTIRNVGDSKNRIVATVDVDGNRSAVTTDAT